MDAREWDLRYAEHELVWSVEPNRFLVEEVGELPAGRALDLACGEGRNAIWLAERGWEVTAVDFSGVAVGKARRLAAARSVEVDWVEADVTRWRPDDRGFDLVVALYLHLPPRERRELLGRIGGWVVDGGTVLVVGHDRENIEHGYGGPQYPEILLAPEEVAAELGGLDIVRAERVKRPVETEDGSATAIDTLVRAVRP